MERKIINSIKAIMILTPVVIVGVWCVQGGVFLEFILSIVAAVVLSLGTIFIVVA